jgi:hypothetical protein
LVRLIVANDFRGLNHDCCFGNTSSGGPFGCFSSLSFAFRRCLSLLCFWPFCLSFLPPFSPMAVLLIQSFFSGYAGTSACDVEDSPVSLSMEFIGPAKA